MRGASGYVLNDVGRDELMAVIGRVQTGACTIEPSLAATLLQRLAAAGDSRMAAAPDPLTRRETEILRLMAQGRTNREIAGRLIVAVGTVKIHVEYILAKLGAADRTQAAVRAVEMGLIRADEDDCSDTSAARSY